MIDLHILAQATEPASRVVQEENHDLLWASVTTGTLSFVGVMCVAVLAWFNNRNSGRVAEAAKATAKAIAKDIADQLDTGNGHTPGQGIARTEKAIENLQATAARVEDRQLAMEHQLDKVEIRVNEQQDLVAHTAAKIGDVDDKFEGHLAETAPLVSYVRGQMEQGGNP